MDICQLKIEIEQKLQAAERAYAENGLGLFDLTGLQAQVFFAEDEMQNVFCRIETPELTEQYSSVYIPVAKAGQLAALLKERDSGALNDLYNTLVEEDDAVKRASVPDSELFYKLKQAVENQQASASENSSEDEESPRDWQEKAYQDTHLNIMKVIAFPVVVLFDIIMWFGNVFRLQSQANPVAGLFALAAYIFGACAVLMPAQMINFFNAHGLLVLVALTKFSLILGPYLANESGNLGFITVGFTYWKAVYFSMSLMSYSIIGFIKALIKKPLELLFWVGGTIATGFFMITYVPALRHEAGTFQLYAAVISGLKPFGFFADAALNRQNSKLAQFLLWVSYPIRRVIKLLIDLILLIAGKKLTATDDWKPSVKNDSRWSIAGEMLSEFIRDGITFVSYTVLAVFDIVTRVLNMAFKEIFGFFGFIYKGVSKIILTTLGTMVDGPQMFKKLSYMAYNLFNYLIDGTEVSDPKSHQHEIKVEKEYVFAYERLLSFSWLETLFTNPKNYQRTVAALWGIVVVALTIVLMNTLFSTQWLTLNVFTNPAMAGCLVGGLLVALAVTYLDYRFRVARRTMALVGLLCLLPFILLSGIVAFVLAPSQLARLLPENYTKTRRWIQRLSYIYYPFNFLANWTDQLKLTHANKRLGYDSPIYSLIKLLQYGLYRILEGSIYRNIRQTTLLCLFIWVWPITNCVKVFCWKKPLTRQ